MMANNSNMQKKSQLVVEAFYEIFVHRRGYVFSLCSFAKNCQAEGEDSVPLGRTALKISGGRVELLIFREGLPFANRIENALHKSEAEPDFWLW